MGSKEKLNILFEIITKCLFKVEGLFATFGKVSEFNDTD